MTSPTFSGSPGPAGGGAAARIADERVLGPIPVLDAAGTAAMWIPTRSTMLGGIRLSVPAPGGARLEDPALQQRARAELEKITGARWPASSAPSIHDHLLDERTRADYHAKGLRIEYDPPETRYYAWSGTIDGLHVEVTGAIGAWAALAIVQPLAAAEALDGGVPRRRPADALALVRRVAPAFAARPWQEDAAAPPPNVVDVSLHDEGARLRAGVRARGPANAETYFYGVRVSWAPAAS